MFFHLTSLSSKSKINKSISLFLSHIGQKRCWAIRLQDFKSDISLEQNDEIVYFCVFFLLIPEIKIEKYWSGYGQKWFWPPWSQGELSKFFGCWCKFREVKNYFNNFWVVVVKNVHGNLISEWMDESSWFFTC